MTDPDLYFMVCTELLQGILTRKGIQAWWETPLPRLNGQTPREALADGRHHELLTIVRSYRDPDFT